MTAGGARIAMDALAAWKDGDLERARGLIAPDAEFRPLRAQLEGTRYIGPDGLRELWADLSRDWAELEFEPEETHEQDEHVVVIGGFRARAPGGEPMIETRVAWHWIVRHGKLVSGETHSDPAEALRQAGLDESTGREVELVRRHYDAYNRDDIDGMVATLHERVEIVTYDERGKPERRMTGRAAARGLFVEIKALVADRRIDVLSLEARPGRVEASLRLHGTLRATDRTGSIPAIHVIEIRDDRIARIETFRPDWRS